MQILIQILTYKTNQSAVTPSTNLLSRLQIPTSILVQILHHPYELQNYRWLNAQQKGDNASCILLVRFTGCIAVIRTVYEGIRFHCFSCTNCLFIIVRAVPVFRPNRKGNSPLVYFRDTIWLIFLALWILLSTSYSTFTVYIIHISKVFFCLEGLRLEKSRTKTPSSKTASDFRISL